jgi:hypothetical protein
VRGSNTLAPAGIAIRKTVSAEPLIVPYAALGLFYTIFRRHLSRPLAGKHTYLGANVTRSTFIAVDLHCLLFSDLPANL